VTDYNASMIRTFANKETEKLYIKGKSKRLPSDLIKRAVRRLEYINLAKNLEDLRVPLSNRLHALKGDRKGQFSISINDQWRICFRYLDGDAYDVEITDYH
jgi:proteic killer suppression protein